MINHFASFFDNDIIPQDKDPIMEVGFGFSQKLNDSLKGAVDFKVDDDKNTSLRFGTDYKIDNKYNLKSRLQLLKQDELRVGFILTSVLSSYSKLSLSADLNTKKINIKRCNERPSILDNPQIRLITLNYFIKIINV